MASNRAFSQCALALRHATCHAPPLGTSSARIPLTHRHSARQTQCYASTHARRSPSPPDVFSLADIPLSSIEGVVARNGDAFKTLSPREYYAAAEKFAAAISRGSNPYSISLPECACEQTFVVTLNADSFPDGSEIVHQLACIMRQIHRTKSADAFATAMWASASATGHRAATLSLARQLIRSGAYGRVPPLRSVEAHFRQLVDAARDADALTAQGELLFEQGRFDVAATSLKRALALKEEFEWRPYCLLCLAKTYHKTGRTAEAQDILSKLADEGLAEADVELVGVVSDPTVAEQHMYNAACHGRLDMFTRLSEAELNEGGARSGKERMLWALEWAKLAEGKAEH